MSHRVDDEEIDAHGTPVHLAQAGDTAFDHLTRDVEAQAVAELEAEFFGQAVFHAQAVGLVGRPDARHHLVVGGLLGAVRQVEFALDQALPAVGGVLLGLHGGAVDRDQPAADHGKPVVALHTGGLEGLLERVGLLGLHVDDETIGRIGRRGVAPAGNEVGAQQHQQHQRQQADGHGTDLHHRVGWPRGQLARGQHQGARSGAFVHAGTQQAHRAVADEREHPHRDRKPSDRNTSEHQVAAGRQQQHGKARHTQAQHRQCGGLELAHVAADHAQRRHLSQLEHRREAEGEHERESHAQAQQRGPGADGRQGRFHQPRQQQHEHMVHGPAERHPQGTGGQANEQELVGVGARHGALRQTQHAQHGAVVQVVLGKPARCDGHGHGRQQRGEQGHEVEEFLGPRQRLLHFGPAAFERFESQPTHTGFVDFGLSPVGEALDRRVRAGDGEAVGEPAGGLHQAGGGQVGVVDHHAGREAHEAGAAVGLDHDHLRNAECRIAQQQVLAHAQIELDQQRGVHPGGAGRGDLARGHIRLARLRCHTQAAAQRIAGSHRLERHQLGGTAVFLGRTAHGGKAQRLHRRQALGLGLLGEDLRRDVVAAEHRVAPDERPGVALQAALQPVGKEPDRGQCRHRQRHRDQQQAQFTGPPVAPKGAPAQGPEGNRKGYGLERHGGTLTQALQPRSAVRFEMAHRALPALTRRESGWRRGTPSETTESRSRSRTRRNWLCQAARVAP